MHTLSILSIIALLAPFLSFAYPAPTKSHKSIARFSIGGLDIGKAFDDAKKKAEEDWKEHVTDPVSNVGSLDLISMMNVVCILMA